jgi:hypothetical protein
MDKKKTVLGVSHPSTIYAESKVGIYEYTRVVQEEHNHTARDRSPAPYLFLNV